MPYWTDAGLDEDVARAKRHLHLADASQDAVLREVRSRRLQFEDGTHRTPDNMCTAMIWWEKA